MKSLTLHVGMVKTGTTSIQSFLSQNRTLLETKGWTFPKSPGLSNQTRLAAYARTPANWNDDLFIARGIDNMEKLVAFREHFAKSLTNEILGSKNDNFVMSSEHCSSRLRSVEEVTALKNLLSPLFENIRIILYVRRQDELAASMYATSIRVGKVNKFSSSKIIRSTGLDFEQLSNPWILVFGDASVSLRLFDKRALKDQDLIADFCEALSIPMDPDFIQPARLNKSYDEKTLEFLRLINAHIPRFKDGKINPARANLTEILEAISTGPAGVFSAAVNRDIMRLYRDSNETIRNKYFSALDYDPFAHDGTDEAANKEDFPRNISLEDCIELSAKLWSAKATR